MEFGGNKRLQEFLEQYHLNHESANMKYRTRAAEYYREVLRHEVDGVPFHDAILSYDEGRQTIGRVEIPPVPIHSAPPPPAPMNIGGIGN